jgi:hypothetical protein
MSRPAGRTHLPKRTDVVRAGFPVRGPTQTNGIGPIRTPKWVGPVEMPLKPETRPLEEQCFLLTDMFLVLKYVLNKV